MRSIKAGCGASARLTSMVWASAVLASIVSAGPTMQARAAEPDVILSESTKFHLLTEDAKLTTYAIDDPLIDGVACYYTLPSKGGLTGTLGLATEVSDISLACRQYGAIKFKGKFSEGDTVFASSRSLFFKHMQIVRGCDKKRNVLVYMVYSDKLIDGSPKNSTSSVPVMPWGASTDAPHCGDFASN